MMSLKNKYNYNVLINICFTGNAIDFYLANTCTYHFMKTEIIVKRVFHIFVCLPQVFCCHLYTFFCHSTYSYSRLPTEGLPSDVESVLRCMRIYAHGTWLAQETDR